MWVFDLSLNVSSLLKASVLISSGGMWLPTSQYIVPANKLLSWLFRMWVANYLVNFILSTNAHVFLTPHWCPWPASVYVCTLIWSLLIWPSFGSLDCKCPPHVFKIKSHFIIRPSKSCHCLLSLVLVVIIWLLVFHFLIFIVYLNICASCSPHLQACYVFTSLKHNRICFAPCRVELPEERYWLEDPRFPQGIFFRAVHWEICILYYGHWQWYANWYFCYYDNISLKF